MPPDGGVTASTVSLVALKSHKRSFPGPDPPSRHVVPEHVVVSMTGEGDVGSVNLSQRPRGVEYSPTAFGSTLALDVPIATHTSMRVHPTLVSGTEMLKAGVPFARGTLDVGVEPQLASSSAPAPSTATTLETVRTRMTARLTLIDEWVTSGRNGPRHQGRQVRPRVARR